jgi:hypothetical protein
LVPYINVSIFHINLVKGKLFDFSKNKNCIFWTDRVTQTALVLIKFIKKNTPISTDQIRFIKSTMKHTPVIHFLILYMLINIFFNKKILLEN